MKLLEERIVKDGRVLPGEVLKVDSFLNHQIDVELISELGAEWKRLYENEGVTKILTIEASGIGIACLAALHFGVPVVFAKKRYALAQIGEISGEILAVGGDHPVQQGVIKEGDDAVLVAGVYKFLHQVPSAGVRGI